MSDTIGDALAERLSSIPGWLSPGEARALYHLAENTQPGLYVVELGAWLGKSAVCMALGMRARNMLRNRPDVPELISIDLHTGSLEHQPGGRCFDAALWDGKKIDTFPSYIRNLDAAGVAALVQPICKDTADFASVFSGRVGLLYIDAAHEYEGVMRDWRAWFPHVVEGGVVAFHDYMMWPGVTQAVSDVCHLFGETGVVDSLWYGFKSSSLRGEA